MGFINDDICATSRTSAFTVGQTTLKRPIGCAGVALHSGVKVSMKLSAGDVNTGIVFKRTDIAGGGAHIPARWDNVVDTRMSTTLGNDDGVTVGTVEHLMAAFAGCGIDNAIVEINGPEVPVMDGSAAPFVLLIECAGTVRQDAPRQAIRVRKRVEFRDGDQVVSLNPADDFSIGFEIDFDSPVISHQSISIGLVNGSFKKELARARTFGFLDEVEQLWAAGLAKGGSLENVVVISGERILNEDGLRFEDEFVRHKVLDAVGDLYLAGGPILGRFEGVRSGHAANNRILTALFADPDNWSVEDMRDDRAKTSPGTPLAGHAQAAAAAAMA